VPLEIALLILTTSRATGSRDGLLTPTDVNPIAGTVSAPPVMELKVIVPNGVSAAALLNVVPTPVVFVAVKIPPVIGTEVVCAKLGIAETALTPIALKREKNRVVDFMFLVIW
jgi:hypothetical protein